MSCVCYDKEGTKYVSKHDSKHTSEYILASDIKKEGEMQIDRYMVTDTYSCMWIFPNSVKVLTKE